MRKNCYILFILLVPVLVCGQGGDLSGKNVLIIKKGPVTVKNPRRFERSPVIIDTTKIEPKLEYSFMHKAYATPYTPDEIPAARIKRDKIKKLYPGYIKIGVGNAILPKAEFYYTSTRNKKNTWGVYGNTLISKGLAKVNYSGFGDNEIGIFGSKIFRTHKLKTKLSYRHDYLHHYGFDTARAEPQINKDFVKQRFNIISSNSTLISMYKDTGKVNHIVDLDYRFMDDFNGVNEHYVRAAGDLNRYYGKEKYALLADLDVNSYKFGSNSVVNSILKLNPNISTISKKWRLKVGLNLSVLTTSKVNFHFYPEARFHFNIVDNIVIPYASLSGGLERINFFNLTRMNPFLDSDIPLMNVNNKYKFIAGIRGSMSKSLTYNLALQRNKYAGLPLFVKDWKAVKGLPSNTFTVVYDTVKTWDFGGQFAYQQLEKLKIIVDGHYYLYETLNEVKAWHRPDYKFQLLANYDLKNKIIAKAAIFVIGTQYAKPSQPVVGGVAQFEKIKGITDVNLGLEYRYTSRLSAFLDFNNMLSFKYYRWQHYPMQQFNIVGGVTYSF